MEGLIQSLRQRTPEGQAETWSLCGFTRSRLCGSGRAIRLIPLLITTTLLAAGHPHLDAQAVTPKELPAASVSNQDAVHTASPSVQDGQSGSPAGDEIPDLASIPHASPLPSGQAPRTAVVEADKETRHGSIFDASGHAKLTYGDHVLRADTLAWDQATDIVTATGHVELSGGVNNEHIRATHGNYNLGTQTGSFYDVHGSVGLFRSASTQTVSTNAGIATANASHEHGYQNSNPFVFQGRLVVKTSPTAYTIYNGSVTTCLLPDPDWQLFSGKIAVDSAPGGKASAAASTFKLIGLPLLFLPYVTHPVDASQRQSGVLIPEFGYSSASKNTGSQGLTLGDQYYQVLGNSADLTLGLLYYSLRGWSENGAFRYKGMGQNFFTTHFTALQDRGFYAPGVNAAGQTVEVYNNQGGVDIVASFRRDLSSSLRAVGDAEYLSSFIYREAFAENFNQAVSTDITSVLYLIDQKNGFSYDARFDRYQGLKIVPTDFSPSEEVKIYHVPSLDLTGLDRPIAGTPLLWSFTGSAAGLKRVDPNFTTSGLTWRMDLRPELSLPLRFDGWHMLANAAVRETLYSNSQQPIQSSGSSSTTTSSTTVGTGTPLVELNSPLNRADADLSVDLRPPVLERTFTVPQRWRRFLGDQVRHTIEPEIVYRSTSGIDNFRSVLRFDGVDLDSDTNEIQYGFTQHLYFRPHARPPAKPKPGCPATPVAAAAGQTQALPAADTDDLTPDSHFGEDANGITSADANAPGEPLRTHPRKPDPCAAASALPAQREWFSWLLAQKYFFDPTFGDALLNGKRNIFDTTLNLSGVAFLTQLRNLSPIISRMRFRTSGHADIAWDLDYDPVVKRFTGSNTYLDLHENRVFGGFSYSRLDAPGKTYSEVINYANYVVTGLTSSPTSDFSQMRALFGYGKPSEAGFSGAASAGLDLNLGLPQYITLQANYNWNCCGLAIEYRRYELGTIRNENAYSFNFTLANIGSAGNLRRAESLF